MKSGAQMGFVKPDGSSAYSDRHSRRRRRRRRTGGSAAGCWSANDNVLIKADLLNLTSLCCFLKCSWSGQFYVFVCVFGRRWSAVFSCFLQSEILFAVVLLSFQSCLPEITNFTLFSLDKYIKLGKNVNVYQSKHPDLSFK